MRRTRHRAHANPRISRGVPPPDRHDTREGLPAHVARAARAPSLQPLAQVKAGDCGLPPSSKPALLRSYRPLSSTRDRAAERLHMPSAAVATRPRRRRLALPTAKGTLPHASAYRSKSALGDPQCVPDARTPGRRDAGTPGRSSIPCSTAPLAEPGMRRAAPGGLDRPPPRVQRQPRWLARADKRWGPCAQPWFVISDAWRKRRA